MHSELFPSQVELRLCHQSRYDFATYSFHSSLAVAAAAAAAREDWTAAVEAAAAAGSTGCTGQHWRKMGMQSSSRIKQSSVREIGHE